MTGSRGAIGSNPFAMDEAVESIVARESDKRTSSGSGVVGVLASKRATTTCHDFKRSEDRRESKPNLIRAQDSSEREATVPRDITTADRSALEPARLVLFLSCIDFRYVALL